MEKLTTEEVSELIDKHIAKMWGSLEMASVQYFIETGKITGSFRMRLIAMLKFAEWRLGERETLTQTAPATDTGK